MFNSVLGNFSSTLSNKVKGTLRESAQQVISNENDMLSYVLSKRSYLVNEVEKANNVVGIFSQLSDAIPTDDNITVNINTPLTQEVAIDREVLSDGIDFIRDTYGQGYTFTDNQGRLFNLYFESAAKYPDGRLSYMHQMVDGETHHVLYEQDGKFYCDPRLFTSNFSRPHAQPATTILSRMQMVCAREKKNFNGCLNSLCDDKHQTIMGSVEDRQGDNLYDKLYVTVAQVFTGKVCHLFDVVKAYIDSSEINSSLLDVVKAMSNGISGIANFMNSIAVRIGNASRIVKQFFIDVANAYSTGGFKGVVMFIFNYFRSVATVTDKDGCLTFTNNSKLVPTQYIAGMVTTIISTATTLVGMLVSIFQPVIGAAIAGIGGLIYGIFKSISYDADATRCGLQTSDFTAITAGPWALFAYEAEPNERIKTLISQNPIVTLRVPGGFILLGPGSFNEDSSVRTVRCEFHPDIHQHLRDGDLHSKLITNEETTWLEQAVDNVTVGRCDLLMQRSLCNAIVKRWLSNAYDDNLDSNDSNNRLSVEKDQRLQINIYNNTFVFLYWLYFQHYLDEDPSPLHLEMDFKNREGTSGNYFLTDLYLWSATPCSRYSNDFWTSLFGMFAPMKVAYNNSEDRYVAGSLQWEVFTKLLTLHATKFPMTQDYIDLLPAIDWVDEPIIMPEKFDWAVVPAKYDASTFLSWIITTVSIVAIATAVTVVASIGVRKAVCAKRASLNREVEAAWEKYKNGDLTYSSYKKTVKKANRWQMFIGGTKYDYENYWNGDVSSNDTPSTDVSSTSTLSQLTSSILPVGLETGDEAIQLQPADTTSDPLDCNDIARLIIGDAV